MPANLEDTDPVYAIGLVLVSALLWMTLLIGYYRKWVLRIFALKRNLIRLKENGVSREAKILSVTNTSGPVYELNLSFKNLADTEIIQKVLVTENDFEVGKRVGVIIDKELKHTPYLILADTEAVVSPKMIALANLAWFSLLTIITAYFLYSYEWENEGMGWRFMSLRHPLIVCPLVLLFYRGLITFIHKSVSSQSGDTALIKFGGMETSARVTKISQTGRYINQQEELNFELEYTDYRGRAYRQHLKKALGLLNLDMTKQETLSIFYLKEDPSRIVFTADLGGVEAN